MPFTQFDALIERLRGNDRVIVQAHDFPDHDAIGSAFALAYLLRKKGLTPFITYQGFIDRISLRNLIDWLDIPIAKSHLLALKPDDKIIVVDGCIGEKNVTDLPGLEVGVIDHHEVTVPSFVGYKDVRPDYGSTATIMIEYFNHYQIAIPKKIATALLVGLTFDTANFTRAVGPADTQALLQLHKCADREMVNRICRNQIEFHELSLFDSMLSTMRREKNCAFASLPEGCPKNMLGVLGDFLMSVDEIDVVVLSARNRDKTFISLRSECQRNNVAAIVKRVLNDSGIGFGGGHAHMAGGVINEHFQLAQESEYIYALFRPQVELSQ
ncbi:DHH family phosphoesterase [Photobacterium rosenbergii]|uniref:DHH family phosphoesterase n=1 Tax=Photobacterium rosenbergii TaxID=294936 RepID=A0ABU3ZDJ0_9GAMM|nr:DHH family phosphoesterase [Photobacterium rosenbergii]MDV5168053.1 DHH family phosphoesterase [Photobacterium rosenbergii]